MQSSLFGGRMNRTEFNLNEKKYDLSHLNDYVWDLKQAASGDNPERNYRIKINFSCHCFTKGIVEGKQVSLLYCEKGERRTFCLDRYKASLTLRDHIFELQNGYVFINDGGKRSRKKNYLKIPTSTRNYEIYFTLSKSSYEGVDLNLFVSSAFFRTHGSAGKLGKIRFMIAVYNTVVRKTVKAPPKHRQ